MSVLGVERRQFEFTPIHVESRTMVDARGKSLYMEPQLRSRDMGADDVVAMPQEHRVGKSSRTSQVHRRLVLSLSLSLSLSYGALSDRKREPVVVAATPAKFARFVDQGYAASSFELWRHRQGTWEVLPFQVDEVGPFPQDVKPFMADGYPGRMCFSQFPGFSPDFDTGPCELLYSLRGAGAPTGNLSTNDEIVFLAGTGGDCNVSTSDWAPGMDTYRYMIEVEDVTPTGPQNSCVYLYRRVSGTAPVLPDLVQYYTDPAPQAPGWETCKPTSDACGSIVGQAYDLDGDGTTDDPSYRFDFLGNWTIDQWRIGETTAGDAGQDLVDIIKWRIESPHETERVWDIQDPQAGGCASFTGFIDGPVRVIRAIEGAASGVTTRKLEFAYPGEMLTRVYLRVHPVQGPIATYPDLLEENVSPGGGTEPAKIFKAGFTTGNGFDTINGRQPSDPTFGKDDWYQLSSTRGSFLVFKGTEKYTSIGSRSGDYDDVSQPLWTNGLVDEYDWEAGDKGAARHFYADTVDSQNPDCQNPREDFITPILEHEYFMLSSGYSDGAAGADEIVRRNRGPLSQCIQEEQQTFPIPPPSPCGLTLTAGYGHDGGIVDLGASASGCSKVLGWNLYQVIGGGTLRRLASMGVGETYKDAAAQLNELRTYRAAPLLTTCSEGSFSSDIYVLHDDVVPPPAPTNLACSPGANSITATWKAPRVGDLHGFKVLVASQPGGPYSQAHFGTLSALQSELTFDSTSGPHYVVVRAIDAANNESANSIEVSVVVP